MPVISLSGGRGRYPRPLHSAHGRTTVSARRRIGGRCPAASPPPLLDLSPIFHNRCSVRSSRVCPLEGASRPVPGLSASCSSSGELCAPARLGPVLHGAGADWWVPGRPRPGTVPLRYPGVPCTPGYTGRSSCPRTGSRCTPLGGVQESAPPAMVSQKQSARRRASSGTQERATLGHGRHPSGWSSGTIQTANQGYPLVGSRVPLAETRPQG